MKLQKILPARNKKYMQFIREQPCCLTGMEGNDYHGVDPHHEDLPGHGGTGTKPCDSRCVPVSHILHVKMESPGHSRKSVFAAYGINPEVVISEMRQRWIIKGGAKFWVD